MLLVSNFNADKQNGCLEIANEMTHVYIYEFERNLQWLQVVTRQTEVGGDWQLDDGCSLNAVLSPFRHTL